VILVKMGATRTISKSNKKCLSNIPGKHEIKGLQKTAILDTAHILREGTTWGITVHVARTVTTEQLQDCVPYKHGFFRYIIANTVHKYNN
jgi:hypothetical protein